MGFQFITIRLVCALIGGPSEEAPAATGR